MSTLAGLRAAFERCNPKLMSRVMADMRRNNTLHASSRQREQRQQLCPTIGVPRFGYRSAYLRMYCVYSMYARQLLSAHLTSTSSASTIRASYEVMPELSKCSTPDGVILSTGHAKKKVALDFPWLVQHSARSAYLMCSPVLRSLGPCLS